jgi:glycerol-3-phosphate dehydrogenase
VTATFAGIRPLVNRRAASTAQESREHVVETSPSGLVNVTGGKWTTYRKMAEDAVDAAAAAASPPLEKRACATASVALFGSDGADAREVDKLAATGEPLARPLHADLPYRYADVAYAAREEMARNAEDALARRTRATFLNEAAAHECAAEVAKLVGGIVKAAP